MGLADIAKKLPAKGWIMLGVSVAVAIGFLFVLMQLASAPSFSTLLAGLNPAQTGKISSTLAAQGIPYELQNAGTAIAVPPGDVSNARIALATADLLTPGANASSLFNTSSLGQSDFQQQVGYQVALEQQLQDTIDQVQGVTSSTVQLVIPNPTTQLFTTTSAPATAAVLISGGSELPSSAVEGIAALVAGSVEGLSINKVTITSDNGQQLWPTSNGSGTGSSSSLQTADSAYDQTEEVALQGMLAQVLGAGRSSVIVNATLDENQSSTQSLSYTGRPVQLTTHTETESLLNKGGGTAGTTTGTVTTGSSGNSTYKHKITDKQAFVGRTVTTTTVAPGAVESQSVSVLVPSTVSTAELASLTTAVKSAVGYRAGRDTVSVRTVAFAATPKATTTAAAGSSSSGMMGMAKDAVIGIGALVFLFITRFLRKREREGFPEPTWLRELERPRSLMELEEEVGHEPVRVKRLRTAVNPAKMQVEDLVSREPDRVVAQVREWMADD